MFATNYDVYLGTTRRRLSFVGNVPAQLVNDPPAAYSFTPGSPLAGSTTYYWKVVPHERHAARPEHGRLVIPAVVHHGGRWRRHDTAARRLGPKPVADAGRRRVGTSGSA